MNMKGREGEKFKERGGWHRYVYSSYLFIIEGERVTQEVMTLID